MGVRVDPPPQLRIPKPFFENPEIRAFFEQQRTILFQLWTRTGGVFDLVFGRKIITYADESATINEFSGLIIVSAITSDVIITLPQITEETIGGSIEISLADDTFNAEIVGTNATVLGASGVIMNKVFMSFELTAISLTEWIAT